MKLSELVAEMAALIDDPSADEGDPEIQVVMWFGNEPPTPERYDIGGVRLVGDILWIEAHDPERLPKYGPPDKAQATVASRLRETADELYQMARGLEAETSQRGGPSNGAEPH